MRVIKNGLLMLALCAAAVACKKDEEESTGPAPQANFTFTGGDCGAPCGVTFDNKSSNAQSYEWNFGDGSPVVNKSGIVNHTYQEPGVYTATLTARSADGRTSTHTTTFDIKDRLDLLNRTWRMTAGVINVHNEAQQDFFNHPLYGFPGCAKDDLIIFRSDRTGEFNQGEIMCDVTDPQFHPFIWEINSAKNKITVYPEGGNPQVRELITIGSNFMKQRYSYKIDTTNFHVTFTFVPHQ